MQVNQGPCTAINVITTACFCGVLVVGVVVGVICGKEEVPGDEQTNKESQKTIDIVKSATDRQ